MSNQPTPQAEAIVRIPVTAIDPNPFQQRKTFDDKYIGELADSIKAGGGLINPISVRPHPGMPNRYQLIAGECRWRAHRRLGWMEIQAIVRVDMPDDRMEELALIENTKRADLLPMEEANGYQRLLEANNNDVEVVARKTGTGSQTIQKRVALLALHSDVQIMVDQRKISLEMAEVLLSVEDPEQQKQLAAVAVQARFDLNRLKGIVANANPKGNGAHQPAAGKNPNGPKPVKFKVVNAHLIELMDDLERLDMSKLSAEDAHTLETQLKAVADHITEEVLPRVRERRERAATQQAAVQA